MTLAGYRPYKCTRFILVHSPKPDSGFPKCASLCPTSMLDADTYHCTLQIRACRHAHGFARTAACFAPHFIEPHCTTVLNLDRCVSQKMFLDVARACVHAWMRVCVCAFTPEIRFGYGSNLNNRGGHGFSYILFLVFYNNAIVEVPKLDPYSFGKLQLFWKVDVLKWC
jgi:hypothetical protein